MSDPRNPVVQTGNDKYIYGTVTWAEPVEYDERKLLRSNAGAGCQNWECKGLEIAANMKLITSNPLRIFGLEDAVPYPSASEQLESELELAAVIGREASNVAEADAFSYIAGFTIFNDWSCRRPPA